MPECDHAEDHPVTVPSANALSNHVLTEQSCARSFLINSCLVLWRVGYLTYPAKTSPSPSFIGHDYPIMLDVGELDLVAMTLQESARYMLGDGTDEAVDKTWGTLFANPPGLGRVHFGENERIFSVTFAHQLHCVRELARAFHSPRSRHVTMAHQQHCLAYLRQTLLCDAADTLGEGDFMLRDFEVDRTGGTAVCYDWEHVYSHMGKSYREWRARRGKQTS